MPVEQTEAAVMEWSEPPARMRGRGGALDYKSLYETLAQRRGEWAKVGEVGARNTASSRVSTLSRRGMEAVSRRIDENTFGLWARVK